MNTRYYLVRPTGRVDSGYADGSHQLAFGQLDANGNEIPGAGLAGLMYYAETHNELVYQVFSDAEAQQILNQYKATQTAPPGTTPAPPATGLAAIPWYIWAGLAAVFLRRRA